MRGSWVSLLAWEGKTLLEVARQAGHSVAVCDRHYAGIFEAGPTERTSVAAAIRAAREPGVRGCTRCSISPMRGSHSDGTKRLQIERWAIQDSNLGPLPYQRSALTD